jgi:hypothetical protein
VADTWIASVIHQIAISTADGRGGAAGVTELDDRVTGSGLVGHQLVHDERHEGPEHEGPPADPPRTRPGLRHHVVEWQLRVAHRTHRARPVHSPPPLRRTSVTGDTPVIGE